MSKPLLVLDTNVVLDLLHFDDTTARPLRLALEDGRVRCVANVATLDELQRVLSYPEFALDTARQAALFAHYQAWARLTEADVGVPQKGTLLHPGLESGRNCLPRCSDSDDQKFIELAAASGAQGVVSKDRAVLKLRRRCAPLFRVMTPAEAVYWLSPLPGIAR